MELRLSCINTSMFLLVLNFFSLCSLLGKPLSISCNQKSSAVISSTTLDLSIGLAELVESVFDRRGATSSLLGFSLPIDNILPDYCKVRNTLTMELISVSRPSFGGYRDSHYEDKIRPSYLCKEEFLYWWNDILILKLPHLLHSLFLTNRSLGIHYWDNEGDTLSFSQVIHRPFAQIPQCTSPISHNAPFCNRNVHMCAHFCYKMVHCGIFV